MERVKKTRRHRSAKTSSSVVRLIENMLGGRKALKFPSGAKLFSQGEPANALYFIQAGKVSVTVASARGKTAVLALYGRRDFLGQECLSGRIGRASTATFLEPSTVFRIEKRIMLRALHTQPKLTERFVTFLLERNLTLEEDLCDQLFNHSEERLARVLLKLSRLGHHGHKSNVKMPRLSHQTLADMVGTTRGRINFFMNKFRNLGLIQYQTGSRVIIVMAEALTISLLRD